jgi:hypothetical protein
MKPVVLALAEAVVMLALVAGPAAGQRDRPAGATGGGTATTSGGGSAGSGGGSASGGGGSASGGGGSAVSRGSGSGGYSAPSPSGGSSSGGAVYGGSPSGTARVRGAGVYSGPASGGYGRPGYGTPEDRAVPRGARPNPGVPYTGTAAMRNPGQPSNPVAPGQRPPDYWGGYYPGYPYYPYYPYDPWYLYGYGAFGLGYMYYDPFWWGYGEPYAGYGYGGYGYSEPVGRGSLKLKVEPRDAEVYIDGYYMGTVDDFDGMFQKMELDAGAHRVEIRAVGYQTITFDVRIEPNDSVTYRGELQALGGIKR